VKRYWTCKGRSVAAAILGCGLTISAFAQPASSPLPRPTPTATGPARVPGEVLIKLRSAADVQAMVSGTKSALGALAVDGRPGLSAILDRFAVREARALFPNTRFRDLDHVLKIVSDGARRDPAQMDALLSELNSRPEVLYAEPNTILKALFVPNDPYYSSSGAWGQDFPDLWGLYKIGAAAAWDRTQGAGVVVAVIDTGVDYTHLDLAGNVWQNPGEIAANGIDDDGNGFIDDVRGWDFAYNDADPQDDHTHGTHVAGTIAAVGGNGVGIVGVAPQARVMAVKVLDRNGFGSTEAVTRGIVYAASNGARVLNLSLGATGVTPRTLIDAIALAHDVQGAVVVAAAGNEAVDVGSQEVGAYPANIRDVIAVAASTHTDAAASFSNTGWKLDVAAPGGGDGDDTHTVAFPEYSILSLLCSAGAAPANLVVGGTYVRYAGTSMATPHVAGVAALIRALDPSLNPEQVRQALRYSSTDIAAPGFDLHTGYGRLQADAALAISAPLAVQITDPWQTVVAGPLDVRGTAAGPGFASWTLEYGSGTLPTSWNTIASSTSAATEGLLTQWDMSAIDDGVYTLRLTGRDTSSRAFQDRLVLRLDSVSIDEPTSASVSFFRPGETVTVRGNAAPNGFTSYSLRVRSAKQGWLADAHLTLPAAGQQPVRKGVLGVWDTTGLPADHYWIYVTVQLSGGRTMEDVTHVIVDSTFHAGWPVKIPGGSSFDHIFNDELTAADLDGDGKSDLVIESNRSVTAFRGNGVVMPGWPQAVPAALDLGPAVGDLTGDGRPEIVAASWEGDLYVWSADGSSLPGWPRKILPSGTSWLTITDVDGDGTAEIVAAGYQHVTVLGVDGAMRPGWPLVFPGFAQSPAVADLDNDGKKEIVFTVPSLSLGGQSELQVRSFDGQIRPGWPRLLPGAHYFGAVPEPAIVDLDGDGMPEIVIGAHDSTVQAFHGDGKAAAGWPQSTIGVGQLTHFFAPAGAHSAAVGDLDGDGEPEVVVGIDSLYEGNELADYLYAWHGDGRLLGGWPVRLARPRAVTTLEPGFTAPVLADVDGDGHADVVASANADGYQARALNAYAADGSIVPGFPKLTAFVSPGASNTAAVADLDGDGLLELAWLDYENIYVWDLPASASAPAPWPMARGNAAKTGVLPPSVAKPGIAVYRLYLPATHEHLFTQDGNEYNELRTHGWNAEGAAFRILPNAQPLGSALPVALHRLYLPSAAQHLWTTDAHEAAVLPSTGWIYEGVVGYILDRAETGTLPLYRMALPNPLLHLWTTDAHEYLVLQGSGWLPEGVVGYVPKR
jgi:subtilisin family serine protease